MALVDVAPLLPHARFDIRYATTNNFIGQQVYPVARAYLESTVAQALAAANREFNTLGYGIVVWDAYRPASVSRVFWDRTPEHLRSFLGNPNAGGSPHNRGCAVDMTLYDLKTGELLIMPSEFDDFSDKAKMDYTPQDPAIRHNRNTLQRIMERHGFRVRPDEWWHYDWHDFAAYPVRDVPLTEVI